MVARVLPLAANPRDDSVALGDLVENDVAAGRRAAEDFRRILDALPTGTDPRREATVADKVGGE